MRALAVCLVAAAALGQESAAPQRISAPGRYEGWSQPRFPDHARSSCYVEARDGTRLALDILRPALGGAAVEERLPALLACHRYHRARIVDGEVRTIVDQYPWLATLLAHGYVVCAMDGRGSGASFGSVRGAFTREEAADGADVIAWLARQPWCDGNVGMFGGSYLGAMQYVVAGEAPPALRAIMPMKAPFDLYGFGHGGGILREDLLDGWSRFVGSLDAERSAAPVDGDLLRLAIAEHRDNADLAELFRALPFRDSGPWQDMRPGRAARAIGAQRIAVYHVGGWWDLFARDTLEWYRALNTPQKLLLGPWTHLQSEGFDFGAEHLRWFDHWLKGIANGVMDEPPIWYATIGAGWQPAWSWPPTRSAAQRWYLVGPGELAERAPARDGQLEYRTDYTATGGKPSRWSEAYGLALRSAERTERDRRGAVFTSPPLAADVVATGAPLAHLWIASSASDGDFFVYLCEVDREDRSWYVTEGALRASHRRGSDRARFAPLPPQGLTELRIELLPVSNLFDAGHRVRLVVTGADADNCATPPREPPPIVTFAWGPGRRARLELPVRWR